MPKRQIVLAAVCLLGGMATAAFGVFVAVNPSWLSPSNVAPPPTPASTENVAPSIGPGMRPAKPEASAAATLPALDFSRIAPSGGVSVLAGRGTPKSFVTVYELDKPVASAEVDANGEWSIVTEHAFAAGEPRLAVREGRHALPAAPQIAIPAQRPDQRPRSVTAVESEVVRNLETALAAAKKQVQPSAPEVPSLPTAPARVASADRGAGLPSPAPAVDQKPAAEPLIASPVPITFVYREARPTPLGEKATQLLVEYVRLKGVQALELTGHADERGTDEFNMQLSRARLETIAQQLRAGGFEGRLILVPRGRAEPYQGIDRSRLSLEDLYQLDRRVELRASR